MLKFKHLFYGIKFMPLVLKDSQNELQNQEAAIQNYLEQLYQLTSRYRLETSKKPSNYFAIAHLLQEVSALLSGGLRNALLKLASIKKAYNALLKAQTNSSASEAPLEVGVDDMLLLLEAAYTKFFSRNINLNLAQLISCLRETGLYNFTLTNHHKDLNQAKIRQAAFLSNREVEQTAYRVEHSDDLGLADQQSSNHIEAIHASLTAQATKIINTTTKSEFNKKITHIDNYLGISDKALGDSMGLTFLVEETINAIRLTPLHQLLALLSTDDNWHERMADICNLCFQIDAYATDLDQLIDTLIKQQPCFKPFKISLKDLIRNPNQQTLNAFKETLNTDLSRTNQKITDLSTLTAGLANDLDTQKGNLKILNAQKESVNKLWVQLNPAKESQHSILAQWQTGQKTLKNYENTLRANYKILAQSSNYWFIDYLKAVVSLIPALFNLGIYEKMWRTKGRSYKDAAKKVLEITPSMQAG